jgi:hypothetical protein
MPDKGFSGRAMRILSAIIQIEDDGSTALCDMIEYRGEMWLVPEWLPGSRPKTERPARIILVARRELLGPANGADQVVSVPISRSTLQGLGTSARLVVENPGIEFPAGGTRH